MTASQDKGLHGGSKTNEHESITALHLEDIYPSEGVILHVPSKNADDIQASNVKLAKDKHTVLVPQPSEDSNDPLNWTWKKKHFILAAISLSAFIADFQAGASAPCILPQAVEWDMTPDHVNYANNLNVLLVGIGGCFFMPFLFFWGRAPTHFWVVLFGTFFSLGCTMAPSFEVYYAMKALQGFFLTAGQTSGLAFIQDMFFLHEHARKIAIWTAMFLASPYFGPLFANFIISGTGWWRGVYWLLFGLGCLNVVALLCFLDETWYRRDIPLDDQPANGSRIVRVVGVWQIRAHHGYFGTVLGSYQRLFSVLIKPIILPVMVYYLTNLMWAVGINQTSSILFATPAAKGGYGFNQNAVGYLFFAPIIAVALGEAFSHYFNDLILHLYVRAHNGVFVPEARLWPVYFSALFMVPGLVIIGQALAHHLHWALIVIGWGMFVFGYMVASVAIQAYVLDSYPTASGEVASLINFSRLIGGFSVGYFQQSWGEKAGYDVSFGVQAAIVAAGIMIIPFVHLFGGRMRNWGGPLKY